MFTRRKEKAPLAAQIAAVGHIVNGTADIQTGNPSVSLVPLFIQ